MPPEVLIYLLDIEQDLIPDEFERQFYIPTFVIQ